VKTRKHFLQPYPPTVAMVTGASRGIGGAIARALSSIGLDLVLTSTKKGGTKTTADECRANGVEVLELAHDAGSSRDADRVVKAALARFGQVDVLVNNAGIVIRKPVAKMTDADFDRQLAVNLSGPFYLARRLLPGMVKRGLGRIINVSSISATLGTAQHTGYCASKWGLDGFTKALAEETRGTGVLVVSVLPGSVDTQMLAGSGFPAVMAPWEIADVIRYLCLEAPLALNGGRVEVFG
jgi:NAD(P)-dependent dehydrogenase (short-subunit alcohol dehydrogenase family)